jgi:FkbM family methyltransferase
MKITQAKIQTKKYVPASILHFYRSLRAATRRVVQGPSDRHKSTLYLKQIYSRFPELRNHGDSGLVLDLGANLGHFSEACLRMGYRVIAVEPHPDAVLYLEKRFSSKPEVRVVKKAISPDSPTTFLQLHPDHRNDPLTTSLSASIIEEKFSDNHEKVAVETATLADFFGNSEEYRIVKIDIEGAEIHLVAELMAMAPKIERLLLETHSRFMANSVYREHYEELLNDLEDFIVANGLEQRWFTNWV